MPADTIFKQLENLVNTYDRDIALARNLKSPNSEDNLAIKAAMVGFSYNSSTEEWDLGHFEFVRDRLDKHFAASESVEYGRHGARVRLFAALCLGYLLGLYNKQEINDEEFRVEEVRLPGLIMMHLGKLTA